MTAELDAEIEPNTAQAPFAQVCTMAEVGETAPGTVRYRGHIDDIWTIGPKVHGGTMVAASAAAATKRLSATEPERAAMAPIAAATDFFGAPDPGEVEYEVTIGKVGRQICSVDVDLFQQDRKLVRTAFTYGYLDDAEPRHAPAHTDLPVQPPADAIGYEPGSTMSRIVHVARGMDLYLDRTMARFLDNEHGEPLLGLWLRPRPGDEADPDVARYVAMMAADMSPPVPSNLGLFGWAPTVQMTTYLRRKPAPGWLRIVASTHEVGGRMFDADQRVLDSTGALVAQSRQLALLPSR